MERKVGEGGGGGGGGDLDPSDLVDKKGRKGKINWKNEKKRKRKRKRATQPRSDRLWSRSPSPNINCCKHIQSYNLIRSVEKGGGGDNDLFTRKNNFII